MDSTQIIQVGLIGFGEWSRQAYAPVFNETSNVRVACVAAPSDATRALAVEAFGDGLRCHRDYREVLADGELDAVMLALPNALHAEALEAALDADKHIFFEPPVAMQRAVSDRLHERIAASARVVQVDLELRHLPVVSAVADLVRRRAFGEPLMAKVRLWCNWGHGGGPWLDDVQDQSFFLWLGCWYLDVLDCVFDSPPIRAQVTGGRAMNGRLMDHGWANLSYEGGGIGQFEFNLVATQDTRIELSVLGTAGEVEADLKSGAYRWRGREGDWQHAEAPASQPAHGFEGMRESIQCFFAAIVEEAPVRSGVDVCRRVHAAAFGCAEAEGHV